MSAGRGSDYERLQELEHERGFLQAAAGTGPYRPKLPEAKPAPEPFDEGLTLLVCERTATERLRFARKTFRGKPYFDLRVEWRPEGEDKWLGTKKGLTIKARELADVSAALSRAVDALAASGGA